MAIKITQVNSSQNAYYSIHDGVVNNNVEAGKKAGKDATRVVKRMTEYSKNILKSTKSLAFDVVGAEVPNFDDIKEQIRDTADYATAELRSELGEIYALAKKKFESSGKPFPQILADAVDKQKKDIIDRLKTGRIYISEKEKQQMMLEQQFGSFDLDSFDFGMSNFSEDIDLGNTFESFTGEDVLPDEPFSSAVKKGAVTERNVSEERRAKSKQTNVKKSPKRKSGGVKFSNASYSRSDLRLGDELISETASEVGQEILAQNEELWARTNAAEDNRFGKLLGYQTSIITGINTLIEFNTGVMAENVKAQMEYQGKQIASNEDMITLLKDVKEAVVTVGTYKPATTTHKSLLNGNRLDPESYGNQIKSNFGEMLSSMGLGGVGMMLGLAPTMLDDDMGVMNQFDPTNTLLKSIPKLFMSRKTRAKYFQLNKSIENFGGSFIGKMNELANYGSGAGKIIGKLLGTRNTKVTQTNLGLKDPNQVVGWTSKSDRTLNDVIPTFLSKIVSGISGIGNMVSEYSGVKYNPTDEKFYNYKTGEWNSKSSLKADFESKRKLAYTNSTIEAYTDAMVGQNFGGTMKDLVDEEGNVVRDEAGNVVKVNRDVEDFTGAAKEQLEKDKLAAEQRGEEFNIQKWQTDTAKGLREGLDTINRNIVSQKIPMDPNRLGVFVEDGIYTKEQRAEQDRILRGVPNEYRNLVLGTYFESVRKMTNSERNNLNAAGYMNAAMNVQQKLDNISNKVIEAGGTVQLGEISQAAELEETVRSFANNRDIVVKQLLTGNETAEEAARLISEGTHTRMGDVYNTARMGKRANELLAINAQIQALGGADSEAVRSNPLLMQFIEEHPDLVGEATELKKNQATTFRRQTLNREQMANAAIDIMTGGKLNNTVIGKTMDTTVDALSGVYDNLLGVRGEYEGEGLLYGNEALQANRDYMQNMSRNVEGVMNSKGGQILSKATGGLSDKVMGGIRANIDTQLKDDDRPMEDKIRENKNMFSFDNVDDINNPYMRAFAQKVRGVYNGAVINTGVGEIIGGDKDGTRTFLQLSNADPFLRDYIRTKYNIKSNADLDDFEFKFQTDIEFKKEVLKDTAKYLKDHKDDNQRAKDLLGSLSKTFKAFEITYTNGIENGLIPGSTSGDQTTVRANGGEAILNQEQLKRGEEAFNKFTDMVTGKTTPALEVVKAKTEQVSAVAGDLKSNAISAEREAEIFVGQVWDSIKAVGLDETYKLYKDKIEANPLIRDTWDKFKQSTLVTDVSNKATAYAKTFTDKLHHQTTFVISNSEIVDSLQSLGIKKTYALYAKQIAENPDLRKRIADLAGITDLNMRTSAFDGTAQPKAKPGKDGETAGGESKSFTLEDFNKSVQEIGPVDTLRIFSNRMSGGMLKKALTVAKKGLKSAKDTIFEDVTGYGDMVDLGKKRRAFAKGNRIGLTGVGGVLGGMLGGVQGAAIGAVAGNLVGKGIGNAVKLKFPHLRGSLLAAGYVDAYRMKPRDLYALITNMALSKDPEERQKGLALQGSPEFGALEKKALNRNIFQKAGRVLAAPVRLVKNLARDAKLVFHRTIKYKKLVNVLDERYKADKFSGIDVTSFGKEGLYALVQSLPEATEDDKKFKANLMQMPEYEKLDRDVMNYQSILDKGKAAVEDIPKKIRRIARSFRLFKYKSIAQLAMHVSGEDEKMFYDRVKDAPGLYAEILSWGSENEEDPNKKKIFKVIQGQKTFQQLELDALKKSGRMDDYEKAKVRHAVVNRNKSRYAGLIAVLQNSWEGDKDKMPDFYSMSKEDLYAHAVSRVRKNDDLGKAIYAMKPYQLLERECGKRNFEGRKRTGNFLVNKAKSFLNDRFGTQFEISDATSREQEKLDKWGNPDNYTRSNKEFLRDIEDRTSILKGIRKKTRGKVKGEARRELYEEQYDDLQRRIAKWGDEEKYATGGIVKGPEVGDKVPIRANGGEMIINKKQQSGLFGWLSSFGGKDVSKENKVIAVAGFSKSKAKPSSVALGLTDDLAKKATLRAGPFAGMMVLLSQINRTMSGTLRLLGGNDKGELDEKNKETIAGQINGISGLGGGDEEKSSDKIKDKIKDFIEEKGGAFKTAFGKSMMRKNKGMMAQNLAGGASLAASAGMLALLARNAGNAFKRGKDEGIGKFFTRLTGLDRESRDLTTSDGLEKTKTQLALDRGAEGTNRALALGITQAVASKGKQLGVLKVFKDGGEFAVRQSKNVAKSLKSGFKAAQHATASAAEAAASGGVKGLLDNSLKKMEETLVKFFKDPKILKKLPQLGKTALSKLAAFPKEIMKRIKNFATQGVKGAAKSASNSLKAVPAAGWVLAIASVIWDVANGVNDAASIFQVAPKDVTKGMRITAGIVKGLKSLIVNLLSVTGVGAVVGIAIDMIVPDNWLIENIYKLVAGEAAKEELEQKQQKQKDVAEALGVDSKELTAAENNSLISKMGSGIHALFSSKTYDEIQKEKALKKLNRGRDDGAKITMEDYDKALNGETVDPERSKELLKNGNVLSKIKDEKSAVKVMTDKNKLPELESEYKQFIESADPETASDFISKLKEKGMPPQNASTKGLTKKFKDKLNKFLNDDEIKDIPIEINEGKRPAATQFGYFAKGRTDTETADAILKGAGFNGGLGFWGGDESTNTWTLGSKHLSGNAIDIKTNKLSQEQLETLGKVAKKYGIEWGGYWKSKDLPHFEDSSPSQAAFNGGIVKAVGHAYNEFGDKVKMRLNPGEMVLNKVQQASLFDMITKNARKAYGDNNSTVMARLNESPMLTNIKGELKDIQEAIDIQKKIFNEQVRHNTVAEKFFSAVMEVMLGKGNVTPPAPQQRSAIREVEDDDTSGLMASAMKIAMGY